MNKTQTQVVVEEIWLSYFNEYLFQRKLISESKRNEMKNLICRRAKTDKNNINYDQLF